MNDSSYNLVQAIRGPIMLILLGTLGGHGLFRRIRLQPDLADPDHRFRLSKAAGETGRASDAAASPGTASHR